MHFEVYWLQFAENKLEDIYNYYFFKANPKVAKRIVTGIIDCTIELSLHPKIGPVEELLEHRSQEFRYIVFKNYKILYHINYENNRVEIANVFDARRNPQKIQET